MYPHCSQVSFAEPVLITGITVLREDSSASDPRQVVFKAWARDLNAPAAARFSVLIGPSQAPCQAAPVAQVCSATALLPTAAVLAILPWLRCIWFQPAAVGQISMLPALQTKVCFQSSWYGLL